MTPKEKAEELIEKFEDKTKDNSLVNTSYHYAVQCALICVEEIIESIEAFGYSNTFYDDYESGELTFIGDKNPCEYWRKVKQELEMK